MKEEIKTDDAPHAIGTYSQAIKAGNTVYISGQIALDPVSMEMVSGNFESDLHQMFKNLKSVAEAAGGDLARVVKLTIYLLDMAYFSQVNEVMALYFQKPYPARAAVAVKQLPKNARVEVDAIMVL